ncbi:multicomponent Na+:H+ antiporter subunit E [Alkalibacterium subtropicum]|uniref:Multicomponent Na+:H+ antiporter subunit E n=1 Tax=Alkalibacterium subtropicum TaxID=753702 RepID=A0A1I1JVB7_9LACT|nr:Na+/H+ antiporter subunit E [Alkalibacterium subtropicum]SFC51922.1 multicomponent Na+:H+ antiporter subunit E [Alkalibacterium subtropicum]
MKTYIKTMWEDLVQNKEVIIILSVVWVVLFEELSFATLFVGLLMAVLVVLFTDRFLLKGNYEHSYMIGLFTLFKYALRLLVEIIMAGIDVIPNIITGKADVQIIQCETKLKDELLIDLLANSITLTPGTVTVEKSGSQLRVLALNAPAKDEDARDVIPLKLEAILMHYESTIEGKA